MHDHLKFWKVGTLWVPREPKDSEKINLMGLYLQQLLQYADEGEDMLNTFLLRTNHGCTTTNPNQSVLQCNGNIPVHLKPKRLRL
jgi:hypothetical protein